MSSPILPLRAAIRAACLPDATLASLMGGTAQLYDEPPRGALPIYGVFGPADARDASTSSGLAHEQDLAIHVWAKPRSAAGALAAASRLADLLNDAPLALAGHHLVRLAVRATEAARDSDTDLFCATLTLRALTEVQP